MRKQLTDEELAEMYDPYFDAVEAVSNWTEPNHGEEFDADKVWEHVVRNYDSLQDKMDKAIEAVCNKNKGKE